MNSTMNTDVFSIEDVILQIMKYLPARGILSFVMAHRACFLAAKKHDVQLISSPVYFCDSIDLVLWSIDMKSGLEDKRSRVCEYACNAGSLEVLLWAKDQDYLCSSKLFNTAGAAGHINILDYLYGDVSTRSLLNFEECEISVVLGGTTRGMEWIRSQQPNRCLGQSVLAAAAHSGSVRVLKRLLTEPYYCLWGRFSEEALITPEQRRSAKVSITLFKSHIQTLLSLSELQAIDLKNRNSTHDLWLRWIQSLYEDCLHKNLLNHTMPSLLPYMHPSLWIYDFKVRSVGVVCFFNDGSVEIRCSDRTMISGRAGSDVAVYSPRLHVYQRFSMSERDADLSLPSMNRKVLKLQKYLKYVQVNEYYQVTAAPYAQPPTVFDRLNGDASVHSLVDGLGSTTPSQAAPKCHIQKILRSRRQHISLIAMYDNCIQLSFDDKSVFIRSYNPLHLYCLCYVENRNLKRRQFLTLEAAKSDCVLSGKLDLLESCERVLARRDQSDMY